MGRNPSYVIEVETRLTDIKDQIKKYETDLKSLQKKADDMGLGENVAKNIQEAMEKLEKLQTEYTESIKKFAKTKISSEEYEQFAKSVTEQFESIDKTMDEMKENILSFSQTINNINADSIEKTVSDMKRAFRDFKHDTREAINLLKEFQAFVNNSYGGKELRGLEKTIKQLKEVFDNPINFSGDSKDLLKLKGELIDLYKQYRNLKDMASKSTSSTELYKKQQQMGDLLLKMEDRAKKIASIKGIGIDDIFNSDYKIGTQTTLSFYTKSIAEETDELSKALKERRDKLQKEAESFAHTTASTFEFKDGGIQIPVVLDSVAMSKCEDSLKDLIDALSNVSKNNPVDVTLRLFPLKTTKEEQKEVDKYIKNINAQIPNLPDGELKDNVSKFMNQFEKEYQKALMLKIKVGFSDEVKDVERKIELIRQAAKKANIEINPYFTVTEEESNKLKAQLEELQSDFSFDLTKSITKMSDSLQALLKTDNIETWSNHFVNALDRVKNKLNEMKDLIQPLARLYDGSTGKRTPGRPKKDDLEDRNVIDRFSRTMELLNQTLVERDKKPKFNAGEFIGDIQSEINKANIPVEVPIEANVDGFIQDIESKIGRVAINVDVGSVGVISGSNISGNTIPVINAKEVQIESTETTTKTKVEDTSKKTIGSSSKNKNTSIINNELINGVSKKFIEEEFKNVYFKNNQDYSFSKNIDKTEADARHKFWDIYGKYVSLLSKTNTLNSVISRKQGKEESDEDYTNRIKKAKKELKETVNASNELLKKNPFLSSVKLGMSKAQKNALLDKYFKDNNISRKSKISEDTYFENLGRRVAGKGEFKLNKPGARKEMQDIIQKYAGYKALGGAKDLRELTDNPEALKKLQRAYAKLTGTLIETKKANKDVVTSSEEITRKSKYEGVSTDELNQKYKELAEEKKAILDRSEDAFVGNTLQQQEKVGRITNDLSEMYRTLKKAKELEEKGLVTAPNKSIEELRKMGYEMNKYGNPIDAKSLYEYADRIKKRLISSLGLSEEFFEQFGKKSLGDLGKEAFVTSRKNKLFVPLDEEMNNISREIELRKIESQQIKVNTVEVKNNTEEKKKNSVESDKKSDISDVAKETEEVKKQTEEIKNNTKEKQKNKKELYDEQKKSSDLLAQARNKDNKYNKRDSRKNKKVDKIISETDEALNATLNGLKSFISVLDKDDLQLNTKKGKARRDFIVDEYKKYREAGGQTPIEDFTEDKDIKKKLGKIWNDARKDIDKSVWAKKSDSSISVTKNIKNESDAIKENTTETKKNIEAKKELATKKNKDDINDNFEKLRALVSSQGDLKLNTKVGKHNLKTAVNQYQKYVEAGGTRPITDLTDNIKAQEKLKKAYEDTTIAVKEQNEVVSRSDILTSIGKRVREDKIDFGNLSQDVLQKLFNNTMELVDSNKIKSVEEATDYFEEILNNYKNDINKSEPSFVDKKDIEKKSFDDVFGEINRQKDKLFELYAEQFNELYVEAETAITSDDGSDEAKQRIINVYKKILDTATNTNFAQPIIESISKISFDEGSIEERKYIDAFKKYASVSLDQHVDAINSEEEGIKVYRDEYNDVINDGIDKIDNEILFILKDHIESMFRVLSRHDIGVPEDVLKRIHDYNTSSFNTIQEKAKKETKETKDYLSMSNEELRACLANEEKWLAKCKEGSAAYEKRKKNIEEINTLLSSIGGEVAREEADAVDKGNKARKNTSDIATEQNKLFDKVIQQIIQESQKYPDDAKNIFESKKALAKSDFEGTKNDLSEALSFNFTRGSKLHTLSDNKDGIHLANAVIESIRKNLKREFENVEDPISKAVKEPLKNAIGNIFQDAIKNGLLDAEGKIKSLDAAKQLYIQLFDTLRSGGVNPLGAYSVTKYGHTTIEEALLDVGKTRNSITGASEAELQKIQTKINHLSDSIQVSNQNNLSSGKDSLMKNSLADAKEFVKVMQSLGDPFDTLPKYINMPMEAGNPNRLDDKSVDIVTEALYKLGIVADDSRIKVGDAIGIVGDEITIVARDISDYDGSIDDLVKSLNKAKAAGVNVGEIFDYVSQECEDGSTIIYEFQRTMKGNPLFDKKGIINPEALNATDDQIQKLIKDISILAKQGLTLDYIGQNIVYDKDNGFSFFDLDQAPKNNAKAELQDFVDMYGTRFANQAGEKFCKVLVESINKNLGKAKIDLSKLVSKPNETPVSSEDTTANIDAKTEAMEREKREVAALIDEMYRLKKAEDDFGIDDFSKMADTIAERYNVSATLSKYFHFPANELDQMNPDYYAKQYGEKYGEEYVEGVSSKTSDAEQAGAELPNAAKKGTAEAQDSHSPSKVAELLGEYWGEGYANGILNTQAKVKNAVRALVETGKLTTEDLIKDSADKESDTKSASKAALKDIDAGKGLTRMGNEFVGHIDNVDAENYADSLYEYMKNRGDSLKKRLTKAEKQAIRAAIKATKDADEFADKNGLDVLSDALEEIAEEDRVKKEAKQKSSTKGQLNKIINQFNKADALTMDEIDKADSKFKEWIEKAEKLGMDTDAFRKAYREARSKFILDEEDVDKKDDEIKDETKYEIKNKKSPIIPTDPKEREKVANGLFKDQKSYYSEILNYEKELAIAQAKQDDFMIDHYKTRLDDTQKLYDETTKQIEALADENAIQKQSIELSKLRRKNEDEIAKIVANRLSAEQKKKDQEAQNQYFKEAEERNKQREAEEKARLKAEEDERKANTKKVTDEEKAQEKYNDRHLKEAMKRTDKDLATRQKDVYDELGSKVQEYIKLRKIIAQGKELDGDTERVENLKNEIEQLNKELRNTPLLFDKNLETRAMQGMDTIEDDVLRIQTDLSQKEQNRLSTQYEGLKNRLKSSGYDIGFEIENGKPTERFKLVLEDILERIQKINDTDLDVVTEDDIREAENLLEEVRQIRKEGKLPTNKTANENSVQKALTQINSILSENTKGSFRKTKVYDDLVELQKQFKSFDTSRPQSELAALTTKLLKTKAEFEDLSNTVKGKNLFQTFADRLHGTTAQLLAQYLSFQDIIRYARTAFTTIQDLDYQLVDLRKTAKMSTSEMEGFYLSSNDVAKQLGITTSEVIQQASAWSRLGYSSADAVIEMSKLSSQFAAISPGMDVSQATDGLVSTMKAFNIDVSDVLDGIMSKINIIGNTAATSNSEIVDMITRSSSAMAEANNTLEETIALETAAVEITRNAENVGTMFKTLSMRIRGYDEEGEQLEDYEELKGKIADLTKTADKPGGISLFTDANKTEYKSTYQVLKDIHEIYDDLTDKQQAGLLEALGGKRGGQIIGSVMRNWNAVDKAMQNMEKSAGSADAEMGIVEQSITFKMNRLKETWVGVLQGLVDRGDLGKGIDLLTKFSDGIGKVIDELGLFKTAILAISGAELIKRFDVFTKIPEMFKAFSKGDFSAITTPLQELSDLGKSVKESAEVAKRLKDLRSFLSESSTEGEDESQVIDMIDHINSYREAIEGLNLEQVAAVLSAQGLDEQEALSVLTYNEGALAATAMSEAEAQAIITKMGLVETGEALTAEQLAQITTSGILEKQIDKEILGALGLTVAEDGQLVATKTLNVEKAKELILTSDLTIADKQRLLGILGVTAAKKTQIGVTNVLRGAVTKLWATISAHPLIALATALAAVCVGIVTYTKKVKEARAETAKTAKADWEAANKTYRESAETFEDLSKRYVELSKGVDSLGHNVKLTTDEYDEYRETVNKIAELSPDLVQGWNDQNDAILKTRDSVELLGKAYDLTMQKANWQIISQANDIFKNSLDELQEFEEDAPGASVEKIERTRRLNNYLNGQLPTFDLSGTDLGSVWTNESSYLESLMKQLGIKDSKGNDFKRMGAWEDPQKYTQYVQTFFADLSEAERNAIQGYIRGRESQYAQVFEGRRDVFKAIVSDEIIANKQLSSDMKNVLMSWSDTLDADTLAGFDRYTDMYSYIVGVFDQLKGVDQETLELGLTMNADFNNGDITYGEYQARVQSMINLINQLFPDNQDIQRSFKILFGIEEEGDDFGGIDDKVDVIKNKLGYDRTESRHLTDRAKARNKEINEFINGLHPDEADLLLSGEIEIDENTSIKNLKETLDKMKEEAAKNPIEVKTSEFVEDLKKMEDDWQALSTAYDASTTSGKTISATDLQSVTDKFGGIGKNAETGIWNAMSESLENYNEKLVENPGNVEIAKTANNELATSYLDLSGTLEKLIDEDSEYAKETLKQQRVENYEEVVQSRLNVKYKATRKNLEDLAETVAEYSDALSKSDKTAEDFDPDNGQFSNITKQVANLIGEYNEETGELVNPADIDGQFMADNWGLVEDAITGVDGAVDQLYVKLAEANAKKILVEAGLDDSQLQAEMGNISDMLAIASNWTMEPEALLDNSQFMSALAACYDGTQASVNAINAALGTIGMKIQYKTTPRKITVPKSQATNGTAIPTADVAKGANGKKDMVYWTTEQITVDDFEIVSTKTGKGTVGSGAKIGAPTSKDTSGGGDKGGGGDGSDNNSDETFDWIEVTIQRIEEEIARLEERVGNAYDLWINRNKALVEEMKKTSEEIKVQQTAADAYAREANKVELSEDYKKKVREGALNIETIENDEKLVDAIKKYQDAYNKYVAAQDAVQTLTIKMGDLSKEYFDQTKEQYQEQIDLIQNYADLVDERINRTQEKGYFVSKKYYEQLIWFGDENVKQMRSQLDALIKKRDEAVSAGNIKYGSSAWNEMNNEILEVAKSIESATTELVNYRNEMRQLEWDRFDFRMNYIDQLTQEAEFLVDLLDNQKLYEDTGRFNNRGWADAALHASEFNIQMQKALYYATERTKVEQESAQDPANKDLIERRQELLKLQQESITAAYAEKDAIKSLVEEGRYLLSINLLNCWKTLKTIKPQREDETSLSVMVVKTEKINCMRTRSNPLFFFVLQKNG